MITGLAEFQVLPDAATRSAYVPAAISANTKLPVPEDVALYSRSPESARSTRAASATTCPDASRKTPRHVAAGAHRACGRMVRMSARQSATTRRRGPAGMARDYSLLATRKLCSVEPMNPEMHDLPVRARRSAPRAMETQRSMISARASWGTAVPACRRRAVPLQISRRSPPSYARQKFPNLAQGAR